MDNEPEPLVLRPSSVPLLLLQRTQYQGGLARICRRARCRRLYERHLIHTVECLRIRTLSRLFTLELMRDFEQIRPGLPNAARNVLDVGCGLGGISALLARHYDHAADMWLLDRDSLDPRVFYGFESSTAAYSSMSATKHLLTDNGVPEDRLHLVDIDKVDWPSAPKFDLIVSLISWGFHYPVDTYLDQAAESLAASGALILDIRKGTNGEESLRRRFGSIETLNVGAKHVRVAATQPLPSAQVPGRTVA